MSATGKPRLVPPRLADVLNDSIARAERRAAGKEKPITLPWPLLNDHYGGGLWPGLHVINKATGVGGTQFALQIAASAARQGVPILYVGLELGSLDLALRLLGEAARVPWSALWTGQAGPAYLQRVRDAVDDLAWLPFHFEAARPNGFPPSALLDAVKAMRASYPEAGGPGSRPVLVVVDFLQILADESGQNRDARSRVGQASYVLRHVANSLNVVVLCISSVARERYSLLGDIRKAADLAWDDDADEKPINRRIGNTDAIVGSGKESGEIEYSADSVSVMARVSATFDGKASDVVFATAKGRATGAMWSPLHFTGHRYEECPDGGGRLVQAWREAAERKLRTDEQKAAAKEAAKAAELARDGETVRAYVASHPGCSVSEARVRTVHDNSRRWSAAVAYLGASLRQTPTKTSTGKMVALHVVTAPQGVVGVDNPPQTPPASTSRGGRPGGLPMEVMDRRGAPQPSTASTPLGGGRA